jgi:hypothetical protein
MEGAFVVILLYFFACISSEDSVCYPRDTNIRYRESLGADG